MEKILSFLEQETNGKCYTSYKYCHDGIDVPALAYEDSLNDKINLKRYGETNHSPEMRDLSQKVKSLQNSASLFRYFLDGSRKTYKIDDIEYRQKIFPIIAGQTGVACCERVDSVFKPILYEHNLIMSIPDYSYADGFKPDLYFQSLTERLNSIKSLQKHNLKISKIVPYSSSLNTGETFENKGIAKIHDEMIECEKKL